MKNCRGCGIELAADAERCAQCGTEVLDHAVGPVNDAPPMFTASSDLNGIGGWLILVALGLAISPFYSLHGMYRDFRLLYGHSSGYLASHHGVGVVILFEAVTNTFFLSSAVALNILFYRKKRAFPAWMIIYLCFHFVLILSDHLAAAHFYPKTNLMAVFSSAIAAAIWIPYYLQSVRVKETFIN